MLYSTQTSNRPVEVFGTTRRAKAVADFCPDVEVPAEEVDEIAAFFEAVRAQDKEEIPPILLSHVKVFILPQTMDDKRSGLRLAVRIISKIAKNTCNGLYVLRISSFRH